MEWGVTRLAAEAAGDKTTVTSSSIVPPLLPPMLCSAALCPTGDEVCRGDDEEDCPSCDVKFTATIAHSLLQSNAVWELRMDECPAARDPSRWFPFLAVSILLTFSLFSFTCKDCINPFFDKRFHTSTAVNDHRRGV